MGTAAIERAYQRGFLLVVVFFSIRGGHSAPPPLGAGGVAAPQVAAIEEKGHSSSFPSTAPAAAISHSLASSALTMSPRISMA